MPLNHYQQEVGPSLADASPGKMPDVALLEGRYCSVEHLTVAEHYKDILDFYFTNQILSDWTYMYAEPFESEEAVRQCLEDYEQSDNPYSLPSGIRLQVRFWEPFHLWLLHQKIVVLRWDE